MCSWMSGHTSGMTRFYCFPYCFVWEWAVETQGSGKGSSVRGQSIGSDPGQHLLATWQ